MHGGGLRRSGTPFAIGVSTEDPAINALNLMAIIRKDRDVGMDFTGSGITIANY